MLCGFVDEEFLMLRRQKKKKITLQFLSSCESLLQVQAVTRVTHSQAPGSESYVISYHILSQAAAPEARIPSVRAQAINPGDMH